jgi:CRISPR-associated protein Cas1
MPLTTHLIVEETGAYVGKHQGRLQVRKGRQVLQEAPLLHLEQVLVCGRAVSFSAEAVSACAGRGIPIHFVSFRGTPYASLYSAGLTGTILTRRAQLEAYRDGRGLALARAFTGAKISNQVSLLRYLAKYRKTQLPDLLRELGGFIDAMGNQVAEIEQMTLTDLETARPLLMGIEGRAAQNYWEAVRRLVAVGDEWPGRRGRGASDPFNAALNYAYGILYSQIERAIVLAGLDPYAGFVHADRPGKPSLVLDLIEEFRAAAADRPVFALFNRGTRVEMDAARLLTQDSRRAIAQAVLERLDSPERYERKKVPLRHVIQTQARHMATFLRGERAEYQPFVARY